MSGSTRFLCRLIGLYCVIAAFVMAPHRERMLAIITSLVHDPALMFVIGILTVLGGLAWIVVHNRWTGGTHAAVITALGWLTLLKGILFLSLSPAQTPHFYLETLHYAPWFYYYMGLSALIGAYLCYGGFRVAHK